MAAPIPEIPVPINRYPNGLLALLDIKSMGRTPNKLTGEVRPTLDMLNFYSAAASLTYQWQSTTTVAAAAAGGVVAITGTTPGDLFGFVVGTALQVPQDEVWLIVRSSVFWNIPADVNAYAQAHVDFNGANNPHQLMGWTTGVAAANRFGYATLARSPYLLAPGGRYQPVHIGSNGGAGAVTFGGNVELIRLKV